MDKTTDSELSLKALQRADSISLEPFQLSLSDTNEPLHCQQMIRIIPGKRLVAFGLWGDKEVVAKLFYGGRKAKQHLARDVAGIDALMQSNVPTPKLLYQGSAAKQRIQIALFEKINDAENLYDLWQEKKESDSFVKLMKKVTIELATQHVLGLLQQDLHLKNFLTTRKQIYTLDGGGIQKFPDILDKNQSMDNLGLFFAQLGVGSEHLQSSLFKIYAKSRGWRIKQADVDFLKALVIRKNKERWMRYQKKIMRTCSSFVRVNKLKQSYIYDREYKSNELLDLLQNPEGFFTLPSASMLKDGRSSTVIKVTVNGRELVVKRYNLKNAWHWLRRCLRATRAEVSWRLSQKLRLFGIATAKPVAYVENRFFGFRSTSYFVMEYVQGDNLGKYFSNPALKNAIDESKVAKMVVNTVLNLAKLKITHGDLKMTNILIEGEKPVLIDLDGMKEHATTFGFKRTFKKEIKRFMKNWQYQPKVSALFQALFSI